MSKYFVFVKIDTDHQKSVASAFGVGGIPDIKFLDADGNVLGGWVGYRPLNEVISEMDKYKGR